MAVFEMIVSHRYGSTFSGCDTGKKYFSFWENHFLESNHHKNGAKYPERVRCLKATCTRKVKKLKLM